MIWPRSTASREASCPSVNPNVLMCKDSVRFVGRCRLSQAAGDRFSGNLVGAFCHLGCRVVVLRSVAGLVFVNQHT